jgi:hypothetical protein
MKDKEEQELFIGIFIQEQKRTCVGDVLNFKKDLVKHGSALCLE